jgi:hypothetical protein
MVGLNSLEKNILLSIDFVKRYHKINTMFTDDKEIKFVLNKKTILKALKNTDFIFKSHKNLFIHDEMEKDFVFRVLLDIKNKNCLTYLYVLKNGEFMNNGLSHFGYLLNFFDISNLVFNENFGINSEIEFEKYIKEIMSIFLDFKSEYLKQVAATEDE